MLLLSRVYIFILAAGFFLLIYKINGSRNERCGTRTDPILEIAGRLGLPAGECVMAGNDVEEDMAASRAGMMTCLVTDFLVNPRNIDFKPDWSGSLRELAGWLSKV